jgi:hypothetical protein
LLLYTAGLDRTLQPKSSTSLPSELQAPDYEALTRCVAGLITSLGLLGTLVAWLIRHPGDQAIQLSAGQAEGTISELPGVHSELRAKQAAYL